MDSLLVLPNRIIRAPGGNGGRCINISYSFPGGGTGAFETIGCGGGSGGAHSDSNGVMENADERFGGGGGGGGAPNGVGVANPSVSATYMLNSGNAAVESCGGSSGDVVNFKDESMVGHGGAGGKTVT